MNRQCSSQYLFASLVSVYYRLLPLQIGSPRSSHRSLGTPHFVKGALQLGARALALIFDTAVIGSVLVPPTPHSDRQGQSCKLCVADNSLSMTRSRIVSSFSEGFSILSIRDNSVLACRTIWSTAPTSSSSSTWLSSAR